jgi:hypothetical protein
VNNSDNIDDDDDDDILLQRALQLSVHNVESSTTSTSINEVIYIN